MKKAGSGKNISLNANQVTSAGGLVSFHLITTDWTGSCGLQLFRLVLEMARLLEIILVRGLNTKTPPTIRTVEKTRLYI